MSFNEQFPQEEQINSVEADRFMNIAHPEAINVFENQQDAELERLGMSGIDAETFISVLEQSESEE